MTRAQTTSRGSAGYQYIVKCHQMVRAWTCAIAAAMVVIALAGVIASPANAATAAEVNQAVERAKEYLYSQQKNGHWEIADKPTSPAPGWTNGGQFGGVTALITHSLLAAGERPTDPRIVAAVKFLKETKIIGVYAMAERLQVYSLLPRTPDLAPLIKADVELMIASMGVKRSDGMFYYGLTGKPATGFDMSCGNYGALGIWAAAECDYEVPTEVWQRIDDGWKREQIPNGGWCYQYNPAAATQPDLAAKYPGTMNMTAAGVATLNVTQDYLGRIVGPPGRNAKPMAESPEIRRGFEWMGKNWALFEAIRGMYRYYGMYNLERSGLASGRRFFGDVDWYAVCADYAVRHQAKNGSFDNDVRSTAFALIFMAYGRAPIVISKLEYDLDGGKPKAVPGRGKAQEPVMVWNQRPRDAFRFTKWLGKQVERKLSWQIVNLKHGPDVLQDSPMLYITGDKMLKFSAEDESALRRYVEEGGMILANAEDSSASFVESVKKLGSSLFPAYEFRELPQTHPIYTRGQFMFGSRRPQVRLLGLTNGTRELMVLVASGDVSKSWEMNLHQTRADAFQVPANIFHYLTDRNNPRERGDPHIILLDPGASADRKIELVRLKYNGNWDPEPGGWRRLTALLHNKHGVDLTVRTATLGAGELKGAAVAHLTGTAPARFNDAAVAELKQFVEGGGLLLIDAAGGSPEFRESARTLLGQIIPNYDKLTAPLSATHPLYSIVADDPIKQFSYRRAMLEVPGVDTRVPRLRGIEVNGKLAIFYSDEDLSTGLVGQPVGGIQGYAPDTATAIVRNIILSVGKGLEAEGKAKPPEGDKPPAEANEPAKD